MPRSRARNGRFVRRRRRSTAVRQAYRVARRYSMRRFRRYHRKHMTLPLAVLGGFVPLAAGVWSRKSSPSSLGPYILGSLTGYVPGAGWSTQYMQEGALPIVAGFLAHWVAGKLGVNRALGRAGVPLVRI